MQSKECCGSCANTTTFDYVAQAHITASDKFYGERVAFEHMKNVLAEAIEALQKLDRIKKALFYGRELPGVERSEDHCNALPVWVGGTDAQGAAIIHGIIGAATEAGELLELLYATAIDGKAFDSVNIGEEVGDVFWYFALLAKACNFTFEESQQTNIAKLRMRYGEKFSEFDALNRNLTAERSILEFGKVSPCVGHAVASDEDYFGYLTEVECERIILNVHHQNAAGLTERK